MFGVHNLDIEFLRDAFVPEISVIQNDSGRGLKCVVTDDIDMTGCTAKIYGVKPDKTEFFYNCTINGKYISTDITNQMVSVLGKVRCQILLTSAAGKKITTYEMIINVKESLISEAAIESSNEFTALEVALNSVNDIDTRFSLLYKRLVEKTGKNLVKNTASTSTINGITFTVNSDKSVTANGTATADAIFTVGPISYKTGNSYTMTGCPAGGSTSTYFIASAAQLDTGSGVTFGSNATSDVQIVVMSGTTISSKVFYPLIRYAEVTDSTYEAYCPSVPEIYSSLNNVIANHFTPISTTLTYAALTSMSYTGVSVVIPANSYWSIEAQANWVNSKPASILINQSSTVAANGILADAQVGELYASCSTCGYTSTGLTAYVWVRYATAAQNSILLRGFLIK